MRRAETVAELDVRIAEQSQVVAKLESDVMPIRTARNGVYDGLEAARTKLSSSRAKLRALEARRAVARALEQIEAHPRVKVARWRHLWRLGRGVYGRAPALEHDENRLLIALDDGSWHEVRVPADVTGDELLVAFSAALEGPS